ncbi:squalene/phytoene synthase domain-containing protein [Ditylenchus destructor]|nr:squalene/phytoene synthase domain-containing protein [Ditylenchus destructor]
MGEKQFDENLAYCMKIVKERDYESFLAALLMPTCARPKIFTILAINAELSMLRQKIKRHSGVNGINQLKFWKDALNVFAGTQRGPLPRQPVMLAMKSFCHTSDVPLLLHLVEGRQETLGDRPFESLEKLEENSEKIYGTVNRLWMNALAEFTSNPKLTGQLSDGDVDEAVKCIARATGILTLLRATVPLLREDIVLLPRDSMNEHGLNADIVYNNKKPEALHSLTQTLCQRSHSYLNTARNLNVPKPLRPALMLNGLRSDYLLRILRKNDYNLLAYRLQKYDHFLSWKLWYRYMRKIY